MSKLDTELLYIDTNLNQQSVLWQGQRVYLYRLRIFSCDSSSISRVACNFLLLPFCYVCPQRVYVFKQVNVCYVSMLVVVSQIVKKNFDVVLAAIAALEVRMLVYLSVRNKFHYFTMSVRNEFTCSNRSMFIFQYILL